MIIITTTTIPTNNDDDFKTIGPPLAVSIHVVTCIYHIYGIGEEGRPVSGPFLSVALKMLLYIS